MSKNLEQVDGETTRIVREALTKFVGQPWTPTNRNYIVKNIQGTLDYITITFDLGSPLQERVSFPGVLNPDSPDFLTCDSKETWDGGLKELYKKGLEKFTVEELRKAARSRKVDGPVSKMNKSDLIAAILYKPDVGKDE